MPVLRLAGARYGAGSRLGFGERIVATSPSDFHLGSCPMAEQFRDRGQRLLVEPVSGLRVALLVEEPLPEISSNMARDRGSDIA